LLRVTILRDETVDKHYLMLSELGRVLQALREALPGACVPQPQGWDHVTVQSKIRVTLST